MGNVKLLYLLDALFQQLRGRRSGAPTTLPAQNRERK
jgi:hypothetical protein